MAGLKTWFKQKWVDIGSKKKGAKGAPTAANFKRAAQTARKR